MRRQRRTPEQREAMTKHQQLIDQHQREQRLKLAAARGTPVRIVTCMHGLPWVSCTLCSTQRKDPT